MSRWLDRGLWWLFLSRFALLFRKQFNNRFRRQFGATLFKHTLCQYLKQQMNEEVSEQRRKEEEKWKSLSSKPDKKFRSNSYFDSKTHCCSTGDNDRENKNKDSRIRLSPVLFQKGNSLNVDIVTSCNRVVMMRFYLIFNNIGFCLISS